MTDYGQIAKEHRKCYGTGTDHLRIYKQLYSEKTHFVYELVQNADDNKSRHLELQLGKNNLLVWNDGDPFSEKDVRSICSIGLSNKDLTQIGTFGIGFKAVYNYTDRPAIYSGDERFCIWDLKEPKGIDEIPPRVVEHVNQGKTVFCLPFKDKLRQEDIGSLRNRLCDLEKRSLLFLRHLETIQWRDEHNGQTGSYSCRRCPHDKIQNALQVDLIASINGENQLSETFLVFRREVRPPQEVIDELLQQAEDDKEQNRIQGSADKQQPIEVAFKLSDGRITAMDSCVLFAYLPTQKETHLRFLIQGRYQTTPARDNIPIDNPWNKWLVQETANFLPEVLERLKAGGLLEPIFFDVLPLKDDGVPAEFFPIAKALRTAMKERPFVPTQDGGYAKAENVRHPHAEDLRELVKSSRLDPGSSWLHPDIRDTERFRRCFKVMREAGVTEVRFPRVLGWLENQTPGWFEDRPKEWLLSLCAYLKEQKSEWERIKKLPLVRLENGKHVCAQLVFFLPDTDKDREEIKPFIKELPILMSALREGDEHNHIESFLKKLGVRALEPIELIREWMIPKYSQYSNSKPSVEENRLHLRYLFKVWDKIRESERSSLKKKISKLPILRAYKSVRREDYDFVVPCEAYLPQAYTENADLETYFFVCEESIWFVDDGYLESDAELEAWLRFLKKIGAEEAPRFLKHYPDTYDENPELRNIEREHSTGEATIEEYYFDGVHYFFDHQESHLSQVLWRLLVKALPSEQGDRDVLFQGIYHWFYYKPKQKRFDADFYLLLKTYEWLPDEQGNLRSPSECFAPTDENRRVLGDSVAYLPPDFDISNEPARWLAEKLGIHLNANTESVLNYLQTLSGTTVSVEDIKLLYYFLNRHNARPREKFEEAPLIFTPNSGQRWWRTDQVFWEDQSVAFGNDRGYLKEDYGETLKPFFIALGVSERPSPLDYVRGIREVTSAAQASDAAVRKRVRVLYRNLWNVLQNGGSSLEDENWRKEWKQTRKGRYWLGKKGSKWDFFYLDELVGDDHDYHAQLFEGKIPFGEFNDPSEFATRYLGVEGCSQAEVKCHSSGEREIDEDWSEKVRNLRPDIHTFLESPRLNNQKYEEIKSVQVLDQLSVRLVEELRTTYTLKGISVPDPKPRLSSLDATNQPATLWLGLEADKGQYAQLISDALEDYFGITELGRFVEDLLTKDREDVLSRYERKGLRMDVSPPEAASKENEVKPIETSDENTIREIDDSVGDAFEGYPTPPQPEEITDTRGGHRSVPSEGRGGGGHDRGGGGGEGQPHRDLKEYLADNPSQLGAGLTLSQTEYQFMSSDRVDILLKDSCGKPVTVEVETHISSENYVGVWQAVKYKHLAAVEYQLPCEQVCSILAAPEIPDDVKAKCKELGIEAREVTMHP